jgi:hypothetical protein
MRTRVTLVFVRALHHVSGEESRVGWSAVDEAEG